MRNRLKNLINGILILGMISLFGCTKNNLPFREYKNFKSYDAEVGIDAKGIPYFRMWGNGGNRGYRPPILFARDTNPKIEGFEEVVLSDGKDWKRISIENLAKKSLENPLKKYANPITCEIIYKFLSNENFEKNFEKYLAEQ